VQAKQKNTTVVFHSITETPADDGTILENSADFCIWNGPRQLIPGLGSGGNTYRVVAPDYSDREKRAHDRENTIGRLWSEFRNHPSVQRGGFYVSADEIYGIGWERNPRFVSAGEAYRTDLFDVMGYILKLTGKPGLCFADCIASGQNARMYSRTCNPANLGMTDDGPARSGLLYGIHWNEDSPEHLAAQMTRLYELYGPTYLVGLYTGANRGPAYKAAIALLPESMRPCGVVCWSWDLYRLTGPAIGAEYNSVRP
jgi:hypothetical protein